MTTRETLPCAECGHKHYVSQPCPDHSWTDWCPYEGIDCPPDVVDRKVVEAAELVLRYGTNPTLDQLLPPPKE